MCWRHSAARDVGQLPPCSLTEQLIEGELRYSVAVAHACAESKISFNWWGMVRRALVRRALVPVLPLQFSPTPGLQH